MGVITPVFFLHEGKKLFTKFSVYHKMDVGYDLIVNIHR